MKEKHYTTKELQEMLELNKRSIHWRIKHKHYKKVIKRSIKFEYLIPRSSLSKEDIEKIRAYDKKNMQLPKLTKR